MNNTTALVSGQVQGFVIVKSPTPEERARELWSHMQLHNPRVTAWDLVCFCSETIGMLAGSYEFLQTPAKSLMSVVYTAHNELENLPSCLK